jgi:hypothetical protein
MCNLVNEREGCQEDLFLPPGVPHPWQVASPRSTSGHSLTGPEPERQISDTVKLHVWRQTRAQLGAPSHCGAREGGDTGWPDLWMEWGRSEVGLANP